MAPPGAPTAGDGHNHSAQHDVAFNTDLALNVSKEHYHAHLHHDPHADNGAQDETAYTKGTTHERSNALSSEPLAQSLRDEHHDKNSHAATKDVYGVADAEKGTLSPPTTPEKDVNAQDHRFARLYSRYRPLVHLLVFFFFTGWWIASLVLHRNDKNWEIPFLLWGAVTLRLLFFYVPISVVTQPMSWAWRNTGTRFCNLIPEHMRIPAAALLVMAVILVG